MERLVPELDRLCNHKEIERCSHPHSATSDSRPFPNEVYPKDARVRQRGLGEAITSFLRCRRQKRQKTESMECSDFLPRSVYFRAVVHGMTLSRRRGGDRHDCSHSSDGHLLKKLRWCVRSVSVEQREPVLEIQSARKIRSKVKLNTRLAWWPGPSLWALVATASEAQQSLSPSPAIIRIAQG